MAPTQPYTRLQNARCSRLPSSQARALPQGSEALAEHAARIPLPSGGDEDLIDYSVEDVPTTRMEVDDEGGEGEGSGEDKAKGKEKEKEKERKDTVSSKEPGPNDNDAGNAAIVVRGGGDDAMTGGSQIPFVDPANVVLSTNEGMGVAVFPNTSEGWDTARSAAQEQWKYGQALFGAFQPLNQTIHQQVDRSSEQFQRELAGAVNNADTMENRAALKRKWDGKVRSYQGPPQPASKRLALPTPDAASGSGEGSSAGSGGGGVVPAAVSATATPSGSGPMDLVPRGGMGQGRGRGRGGRGQGNWQSGRGRGRGRSRGGYGGYGGGYRGGYNAGWNQPPQMGRGNVGGPGGVVAGAGNQDQTQQMQQMQHMQQQLQQMMQQQLQQMMQQQQQMMQQVNQLTQGSQTQGGGAPAGHQEDHQDVQGARSGQAGGFPQDGTGGHQDSLGDRMFD
ncbi:hypothetical protein SUNI508_04619 [Seiridium unicorne]|uniref:Uncharacterized protein n=1 Tax=Seiridium unicorne TaxID=138068 RepID=A0ABR2V7T8_9PEZI